MVLSGLGWFGVFCSGLRCFHGATRGQVTVNPGFEGTVLEMLNVSNISV